MGLAAPKGWLQDSDTCYLHDSGARIERRIYREREGWFLIPADLDRVVQRFASDSDGLEQALAAFDKGVQMPDPATKAREGDEGDDEEAENATGDDEADEGDP